jgi:4-amino-4-deoxy-L-arabinose transferase-like glycosyltransferase
MSHRTWGLAAVFALALVPRMAIALTFDQPPTLWNDAGWYDFFARSIADGNGYSLPDGTPTSRWPPGYAFFAGAVYAVSGDSQLVLRLVQALLGALTAVGVAHLGRTLISAPAGIAAGAIVALMPSHALYTSLIMSEVLFTGLVVAAFVAALHRSAWAVALAGVAFGLAALTRSHGVVLVAAPLAVWLAWGWFDRERRVESLRNAGIMVAAAVMTITPWGVRNAVHFDSFQPISTNFGMNLWVGNNPDATGGLTLPPPVDVDADRERDGARAEVAYDRAARRAAVDWITSNPGGFLSLAPRKVWQTYRNDASFTSWYEPPGSGYLEPRTRVWLDRVANTGYYAVLAVAAVGAVVAAARRRLDALALPLTALVAWTAVSVVFFGDPRFHIPVLPAFALLAAAGIEYAREALASGRLVPSRDVTAPQGSADLP